MSKQEEEERIREIKRTLTAKGYIIIGIIFMVVSGISTVTTSNYYNANFIASHNWTKIASCINNAYNLNMTPNQVITGYENASFGSSSAISVYNSGICFNPNQLPFWTDITLGILFAGMILAGIAGMGFIMWGFIIRCIK